MVDVLQKIKKLDKQKLIAVGVACAVVLVMDVYFILQWQIRSAGKTKAKIAELKRSIADIETKSREFALKKQHDDTSTVKKKKVPAAVDLPLILQEISNMAKEHNVKVIQIAHAKQTLAKAPAAAAGQPAAKVVPVSVRLELLGAYHNIGALISAFENAPEPMSVEDLKIGREVGESLRERVSLGLKTFVRE